MALGKAIEVNEAFRMLKDPVKRAEALLRRGGVAVGELAEPKPSPELLMEFMEVREELSEAAKRRDGAAVAKLGVAMRERQGRTMGLVGEAFSKALGSGGGGAAELAGILPVLGELRYVRRFLEEVSAIEEELASA
jgi:molecular chaperone HscB